MRTEDILKKTNLSIGDVSRTCDLESHTIRYWEKEFADYLRPRRTPGKQRRYDKNDIMRLLTVKSLLWEHKFTIEGARRVLQGSSMLPIITSSEPPAPLAAPIQGVA